MKTNKHDTTHGRLLYSREVDCRRLQEKSGPSETGTHRTVRGKFDPSGFVAFFDSHLLAMHVAGRVKTSALLTGDL